MTRPVIQQFAAHLSQKRPKSCPTYSHPTLAPLKALLNSAQPLNLASPEIRISFLNGYLRNDCET